MVTLVAAMVLANSSPVVQTMSDSVAYYRAKAVFFANSHRELARLEVLKAQHEVLTKKTKELLARSAEVRKRHEARKAAEIEQAPPPRRL